MRYSTQKCKQKPLDSENSVGVFSTNPDQSYQKWKTGLKLKERYECETKNTRKVLSVRAVPTRPGTTLTSAVLWTRARFPAHPVLFVIVTRGAITQRDEHAPALPLTDRSFAKVKRYLFQHQIRIFVFVCSGHCSWYQLRFSKSKFLYFPNNL